MTAQEDHGTAWAEAAIEVERRWPSSCWHMVQGKRPADVDSVWEWAVTVQVLRKPWETPQDAAERVVRLRQAHAERYGAPPTLRALRSHP